MHRHQETGNKRQRNKTGPWIPFLALAILFAPLVTRAGTYGDLTYTSDGSSITITYCAATATHVIVPSSIDGLPVTSIGNNAFHCSRSLTNVVLGNSITNIAYEAFSHCSNLTTVAIPKSVTSINPRTFSYCTSLTNVVLGNRITNLGEFAFNDCSHLTSITLPDAITSIGPGVFDSCTSLTNVVLGTHVTNINGWAFSRCSNLSRIELPDSVTSIGMKAFSYSGLTSITLPNGVRNVEDVAFYLCTSLTNVVLGSAITNIGTEAFRLCNSLPEITVDPANTCYSSQDGILFNKNQTTLHQCPAGKAGSYTIPGTVTTIAQGAFNNTSLTNVNIPESVRAIGSWAFEWSTNLASITVDAANPYFSSLDGVLFNKNPTTLIQYPGGKTTDRYTIPDSVANIGEGAFSMSYNLTDIEIPDTVTNISRYAFRDCNGLTSITIPDSVRCIETFAFYRCTNLANMVIGPSVTNIDIGAFAQSSSLASVTILGENTRIGHSAFSLCTGLDRLYFAGDAHLISLSAVYNAPNVSVYYMSNANGWGSMLGNRPAFLWNPVLQLGDGYGATIDGFRFNISGTPDIPIAVVASTNLAEGIWIPLGSTNLTDGSLDFFDADWTNYPLRVYRITAP